MKLSSFTFILSTTVLSSLSMLSWADAATGLTPQLTPEFSYHKNILTLVIAKDSQTTLTLKGSNLDSKPRMHSSMLGERNRYYSFQVTLLKNSQNQLHFEERHECLVDTTSISSDSLQCTVNADAANPLTSGSKWFIQVKYDAHSEIAGEVTFNEPGSTHKLAIALYSTAGVLVVLVAIVIAIIAVYKCRQQGSFMMSQGLDIKLLPGSVTLNDKDPNRFSVSLDIELSGDDLQQPNIAGNVERQASIILSEKDIIKLVKEELRKSRHSIEG